MKQFSELDLLIQELSNSQTFNEITNVAPATPSIHDINDYVRNFGNNIPSTNSTKNKHTIPLINPHDQWNDPKENLNLEKELIDLQRKKTLPLTDLGSSNIVRAGGFENSSSKNLYSNGMNNKSTPFSEKSMNLIQHNKSTPFSEKSMNLIQQDNNKYLNKNQEKKLKNFSEYNNTLFLFSCRAFIQSMMNKSGMAYLNLKKASKYLKIPKGDVEGIFKYLESLEIVRLLPNFKRSRNPKTETKYIIKLGEKFHDEFFKKGRPFALSSLYKYMVLENLTANFNSITMGILCCILYGANSLYSFQPNCTWKSFAMRMGISEQTLKNILFKLREKKIIVQQLRGCVAFDEGLLCNHNHYYNIIKEKETNEKKSSFRFLKNRNKILKTERSEKEPKLRKTSKENITRKKLYIKNNDDLKKAIENYQRTGNTFQSKHILAFFGKNNLAVSEKIYRLNKQHDRVPIVQQKRSLIGKGLSLVRKATDLIKSGFNEKTIGLLEFKNKLLRAIESYSLDENAGIIGFDILRRAKIEFYGILGVRKYYYRAKEKMKQISLQDIEESLVSQITQRIPLLVKSNLKFDHKNKTFSLSNKAKENKVLCQNIMEIKRNSNRSIQEIIGSILAIEDKRLSYFYK